MVKLKHLKAYDRNDCPDHVVQEVDDLMDKIICAVSPTLLDVPPNLILSAFNRLHAAVIVTLISSNPEEIRNAVLVEVRGLIGNVEDIAKLKVIDDKGFVK